MRNTEHEGTKTHTYLAKTADGDAVGAVAPHVLDDDVGAVRLERCVAMSPTDER